MARYVSDHRRAPPATSDDWWYAGPLVPSLSTAEHHPVDTGLLDVKGNRIMRLPNPMGFGRDEEWD